MEKNSVVDDVAGRYPVGSIVSTRTGDGISFEQLAAELATARIVYIGENHTSAIHHDIQLRILKSLIESGAPLSVGMEMFDHTYQPVLRMWSEGALETDAFLEKSHWYANWRFDFALYREILSFIKENHIPLVGLNVPFHIPPKIRVGGLESLRPWERDKVAEQIDLTHAEHRAYLKEIFERHRFGHAANFSFFYQAQCSWEDTMAESISKNVGDHRMVVLAGNGHIIKKFGIPDRAFQRTGLPFKTVYLATPEEEIDASLGDYIWVTPQRSEGVHP